MCRPEQVSKQPYVATILSCSELWTLCEPRCDHNVKVKSSTGLLIAHINKPTKLSTWNNQPLINQLLALHVILMPHIVWHSSVLINSSSLEDIIFNRDIYPIIVSIYVSRTINMKLSLTMTFAQLSYLITNLTSFQTYI